MIVFLHWNGQKVQVSVNPENIIDRCFHEEAEEFFGFAWVLAQEAKKKGIDPELDMEQRRQNGKWEKSIRNEAGITYEIKEVLGMTASELAEYNKIDPADMRIFTWIRKDKTEVVLDSSRSLLSYQISGKPQIHMTIGKRPPKVQLSKRERGGTEQLVATDEATGVTTVIAEGAAINEMNFADVRGKLMRRLTTSDGEAISDFAIELPSGHTVASSDEKSTMTMKDVEQHFDSDFDPMEEWEEQEELENSVPPMLGEMVAVVTKVASEARGSVSKKDSLRRGSSRGSIERKVLKRLHMTTEITRRASMAVEAASWADKPAVFLIGSRKCKAGHAGMDQPMATEPSIRGVMKKSLQNTSMLGMNQERQEPYCSAVLNNKMYTAQWCLLDDRPCMRDLERIWSYTFYQKMAHRPEFSPVLVTLPFMCTDAFKQGLTESLFDDLGFCGCYFVVGPVTPLIAVGIETGLVVELGFSNSFITPVVNRTYMPGMVKRLFAAENREQRVGGHYMIEQLIEKMRWQEFEGVGEDGDAKKMREAMDIFEEYSYVSWDPDSEYIQPLHVPLNCKTSGPCNYSLGQERWQIPESLFKAKTGGKGIHAGLDKVICDAIRHCDVDLRGEMYANILLAGGVSKLKGLKERLEKELPLRAPSVLFKLRHAPHQSHFKGAAMMANDLKMEAWISAEDYAENGHGIWRLKCDNL